MAFSGYIKVPDIDGESKQAGHEGEIDCWGVSWGAAQSSSVYEFEHEFDATALALPAGEVVVVLQARDASGRPVEGGRETLRLSVAAQ